MPAVPRGVVKEKRTESIHWSPELIAVLRTHYKAYRTAPKIAREMGLTVDQINGALSRYVRSQGDFVPRKKKYGANRATINIQMRQERLDKLRKEAHDRRCSVSDLVNEALDMKQTAGDET